MVTEKKIAANRRNAAKSTGPKTRRGKTQVKLNAVAHGLRAVSPVLPGEQAKDWNDFRASIVASYTPSGALETELVDRVASLQWRLRRVTVYETAATASEQNLAVAIARGEPDPSDLLAWAQRSPPPFGLRREFALRSKIKSARRSAATYGTTRDAFRVLLTARPELRIDGELALSLLYHAAEVVIGTAYTSIYDDPKVLATIGVPEEWHEEPAPWGGWTNEVAMCGMGLIAKEAKMSTAELLERMIHQTNLTAEAERRRAETLEAELNSLLASAANVEKAARAQTALPSAAVLDKVMRYESHLNKQLIQTMHLLERLQATRAGCPPVPPAALDVTVETGSAPAAGRAASARKRRERR